MPPSSETASSSTSRPTSIILSLKDEKFKSIIYRHFRLLGAKKEREREVEAQKAIWEELLKDVVGARHFYKLRDDKRVTVTEQKAFEFIRETIQRRHSTTHLWLPKAESETSKKQQSASIGKDELKSLQSPVPGERGGATENENETLASVAASKNNTANLKRKSPRLKDENQQQQQQQQQHKLTKNEQSPDILLSMLDPYYKQTIFHYYELRKRDPSMNTVVSSKEIRAKFNKYVKKSGGKYYKIGHKGGEQYVVGEDEVIRKIKTDLNKTNRYTNELAATVVLDLDWDTKFSKVVHKYCKSLDLNASEQQERDTAEQIFDELRQKYMYFIQNVEGDRVEITQDEDLIVSIILKCVKSRNETKSLWYRKTASAITSEPPRKKIKQAAQQSASQIPPRARQSALPPQTFDKQPRSESGIKSVLDDRLPNKKSLQVTCRTPIETVSQLIQILQLITLKLNDLHGTQRRHLKNIRLYQLPEFGGDATGTPPLGELAQYMSISQANIRLWYGMCQCAEKRGFNLRLLGDDRIDRHRGIFVEGGADEELLVIEDSGENAIEEYLQQIAIDALRAAKVEPVQKTVKSSLDDLKESDDEMELETAHELSHHHYLNRHMRENSALPKTTFHGVDTSSATNGIASVNAVVGSAVTDASKQADHISADTLEPVLVDHELPFDDSTLARCDSQPNEVNRNSQSSLDEELHDSYSQMNLSIAQVSDAIRSNDGESSTTKITESKNDHLDAQLKSDKSATQSVAIGAVPPKIDEPTHNSSRSITNNLLSMIQKGSRIMVKSSRDDTLYRATVKKVLTNKAEPSFKIHYDGKKSHTGDIISLALVDSIISDETASEMNGRGAAHRANQSNISIKDLLRGKYPKSLHVGKLEHREQCSELGPGWTVYITSRRNKQDQKRLHADRYFISPSGRTCRSIKDLEQYRLKRPEEFDLYSNEDDQEDAVTEELVGISSSSRKQSGKTISSTPNHDVGREITSVEVAAPKILPQCQGPKEQPPRTIAHSSARQETDVHHFAPDSFSPLMMGNPGPAIEDSHSDHEFLSSLMDEKGLLFGDEELEDDLTSLPNRDQTQLSQPVTTDPFEASCPKPMPSCMKCPFPSPKGEGGADSVKKNVHFAGIEQARKEDEGIEQDEEFNKKGLSPRMKHNKRELIGGMMPLFAMAAPAGAEFAGYLGDAHSDDGGSDSDSEDEGGEAPRAAASVSHSSPIKVHESGAFVRISPISLRAEEARRSELKKSISEVAKISNSPNEVTAINSKPTHSAFDTVPRMSHAGSAPPIFPPTSSPLKRASKNENTQLFAFEYASGKNDDTTTARPKRKLKATVRFDPDMAEKQTSGCRSGSGFACPRCDFICDYSSRVCSGCQLECYYEAGIGVVTLKDRDSVNSNQTIAPLPKRQRAHISRPEGVLCNCTYCGRRHFSIQGIYAHHGRAHGNVAGKKLDWANATFSCPFCKSNETFSLSQVEKHVRDRHPGCELVTPNTDKPSRERHRSRNKVSSPVPASLRALRNTPLRQTDASARPSPRDMSPETIPRWEKLDHRSLLPDCKKDYPREVSSIVDLVEEQCRAQEGIIAIALDQRQKLCKAEAEMEAKLLDDDRLAYQRGIRERTRYADAERIEKQRYTEKQKMMLIQYEYENRNRKRTRDEIEADRLCSKPVIFSSIKGRHLPGEKTVCQYDQCELCKDSSFYLQSVMLDSEMSLMKRDDPSSQSLLPQTTVLQPSFHAITKSYFAEAEERLDEIDGAKSRRDIATSKRLRYEENKLFKMRSDQRCLEFIDKYNEGLIRNAWK